MTSPVEWSPSPFLQFILKIHGRCDLSCDYCYVYEMADQSWRQRPRRISFETLDQTARRIAEHVESHGLNSVQLILHGGEPLLAGPDHLAYAVQAVRGAVGASAKVEVVLQTNAVRLNETYLDLFDELDVRVGVSLDGDRSAHDRHRRLPGGRGSHAAVSRALSLLTSRYRHLFAGLLCTIDLRNDPVATYEALFAFEPPAMDFLLPHGNWATPPPGLPAVAGGTPYADWLISIFDHWYASTATTEVRTFADIMHLLLGGASASEALGLAPARMVVIETDGGIEQSDTLKAVAHGAPETGYHVLRDSFDAVLTHSGIMARQLRERALCEECLTCPVMRVCGGGHYAHRYRPGSEFANPSVYCADLLRLITHIKNRLRTDLDAALDPYEASARR